MLNRDKIQSFSHLVKIKIAIGGLLEQDFTAFFAKEAVADDFDGVGKVGG